MNARSHRVPPVVVAALVNIVLMVMGIAMGIAGLQATHDLAGPAPAAPGAIGSREDPPPLTPVLDPAPKEPRPVEQIVAVPAPAPAAPLARRTLPAATLGSALPRAAGAGGDAVALLASANGESTACAPDSDAARRCTAAPPALH